ncbi:acyltransferase [Serratia sp. UGAL515B_01]|uniref:acyltransferase family protein n=1 Tax=Serratia sp. UGAL515B_01 TaxID=2986763 RepID=UPI0029552744|nr:acyltransferase [Serratia sp. UGAL515B_01]WON78533.1 acyltransferase [Serratia sp. UGAL515B_01]
MTTEQVERIVFANILRGVAAIAVLISHYIGIFWVMNPAISSMMGVPELSHLPALGFPLSLISEYCIVLGQFGVGVFFIISGLVIPFSLKNESKLGFLHRRAIRIYPVYIVGFSIVMLSLYALSFYAITPFNFAIGDMLAHLGVITRGPLNVNRIDGISWTLEVEIYFYLIMCVLGERIINFDVKKYIITASVVACFSAVIFKTQGYLIGVQTASSLLFLLGTAYYSTIKKKISIKNLLIIQSVITALLLLLWLGVAESASYIIHWIVGYILGIAVFYICFLFRNKIKENALLSHFSAISYPLYVVHTLFGYAIMYVLVDSGSGPYTAVAVATLCAYMAALFIHFFVERPSMAWIKQSRMSTSITHNTLPRS